MFRVLVMAVTVLFAPPALAEGDVDAVIKGVEAAYKDVQTLRADFVQVTRSKAMGDETRQREGPPQAAQEDAVGVHAALGARVCDEWRDDVGLVCGRNQVIVSKLPVAAPVCLNCWMTSTG